MREARPDELTGEERLIDVREQHEWDEGRIPGAEHIPMDELITRYEAGDIELDDAVLYCRTGRRSEFTAKKLEEIAGAQGRRLGTLTNLVGGYEAYKD